MTDEEIKEDDRLKPVEKEFLMRVSKNDDRLHVYSDIGSVTRALMSRDDFEVKEKRTDEDGHTVGVSGTLPIGALKVKHNARKNDQLGKVVSGHGGGDDGDS